MTIAALVVASACRGGDDARVAENQRVPVWRSDSPRVAAADQPSAPDSAEPAPVVAVADAEPSQDTPTTADPPATATAPTTSDPVAEADIEAADPSTTDPTAEEILLRAERAYESVRTLRADFVQDLTVPLLDDTQRSRGELFHRKPDLFLMRFSDPQGDVVVADGSYLWLYYPSTDPGQVIRTSMGQAGRLDLQREFLSNPTEKFDATLEGAETVAGRPAQVLTLIPREPRGYSRVRIWIDDQDGLARRFEISEDNGNVRTVELRNLRVNVELSADLFRFTPPPGAEIFDQ